MYTAFEPRAGGQEWQFRTLLGLARQIAGRNGTYQLVHSESIRPPHREVEILKPSPSPRDSAKNLLVRVLAPTEAVEKERGRW